MTVWTWELQSCEACGAELRFCSPVAMLGEKNDNLGYTLKCIFMWNVLCQVYLYVKCTFMPSVPLCQTYLYVKCTFISYVPLCQMYLYVKRFYVKCTFMANVPLWQMFLCQMYLYVKWFYAKCFMWNEFMSNDIMSNITDPKTLPKSVKKN